MKSRYIVSTTGCHLFSGALNKGYGQFYLNGKNVQAHRAAWILFVGPIPDGMCVCHKCDTPSCVNVEHLFLGSNRDNMHDKITKGRQANGTKTASRAKLSKEDVIEIRRMLEQNMTYLSISKEFGVTKGCVQHIANGLTWKNI